MLRPSVSCHLGYALRVQPQRLSLSAWAKTKTTFQSAVSTTASKIRKLSNDTAKQLNVKFFDLIRKTDEFKESYREKRRATFTDDDWVRYRSSYRVFDNLWTSPHSPTVRGLWLQIGTVFSIASGLYITNCFMAAQGLDLIMLPELPFQLSSPALALLLVFRTNAVYDRWNTARSSFHTIQSSALSLSRQACSYLNENDRVEFVKRVVAHAYILKRHFRDEKDEREEAILKAKLTTLLGEHECSRVMSFKMRPLESISSLSRLILRSKLEAATRQRLDFHLDELNDAYILCEDIRRIPMPIVYTRHTERFLGLWTFLLPFALVEHFGGGIVIIPISSIVAMFLYGIEEIGAEVEEPLSILPLEYFINEVETGLNQIMEHELTNTFAAQSFSVNGSHGLDNGVKVVQRM